MFTMKGRYNTADIMIDTIDDTTRVQIQGFLDHPAFSDSKIVIMPDCHAGKGAVIGLTMTINDWIIPNVIGVDIGCGMLTNIISGQHQLSLTDLDDFIKDKIPAGFRTNDQVENHGLLTEEVSEVCSRIGLDAEKALKSIGSLGGGNHFIEVGMNSQLFPCVTIHSGSRGFGKCVADFYQKKAIEYQAANSFGVFDKDLAALPIDHSDGMDYLHDMAVAQRFASRNREVMMKRITDFMDEDILHKIESVHNFIGDDNIIRKGATPARQGELVIIPFNMRDGLVLCTGKGNATYNYSAPHGAGRVLSRTQAKKQLVLEEFQNQMDAASVFTTTANIDTIDEAPEAYKDKDLILANISSTVDVVDFVRPVYNFKSAKG